MTQFAGDEVATCRHCRATKQVAGLLSRWETDRYTIECGHIIPSFEIGGVAIVEDDGRFRPPFGTVKEVKSSSKTTE